MCFYICPQTHTHAWGLKPIGYIETLHMDRYKNRVEKPVEGELTNFRYGLSHLFSAV